MFWVISADIKDKNNKCDFISLNRTIHLDSCGFSKYDKCTSGNNSGVYNAHSIYGLCGIFLFTGSYLRDFPLIGAKLILRSPTNFNFNCLTLLTFSTSLSARSHTNMSVAFLRQPSFNFSGSDAYCCCLPCFAYWIVTPPSLTILTLWVFNELRE